MYVEVLNWDSDFFGYKIGKVNFLEKEVFNFSRFKDLINGYKLIYLFSDKIINNSHLNLVDSKVTFQQNLTDVNYYDVIHDDNICSFDAKIHSYAKLKELALVSGVYSRFNTDKQFKNNEYKKLYLEWIKNAVKDTNTVDILLYIENAEILGFVTIRKIDDNLADIGLVAVSQQSRGKGVGRKLINYSIKTVFESGFSSIQVVTQKNNVPAVKLYRKCNFELKKIIYIYHFWNI